MFEVKHINIDKSSNFKKLKKYTKKLDLVKLMTKERVKNYNIKSDSGLNYNYAAKIIDENILKLLQDLSNEQELINKYKEIVNGKFYNITENRMVLHHLLRGQLGSKVLHENKNLKEFYEKQKNRIYSFSDKLQAGKILSSTGEPFKNIVQIGIGGSDLGPRALYYALYNTVEKRHLNAYFISNVDPDDPNTILDNIDLNETLFILVSKSGTTQETLTNKNFVIAKMKKMGINPQKHMLAVTSETSPLASSDDYLDKFFIDDFIGGRYSSCSAVGLCILSLVFGKTVTEEFLLGAHLQDKNALNEDIFKNTSLMDAMIGIHERNILSYESTAILPYSQGLIRFPAHLQQLDMESNGKNINRFGDKLNYKTGPVLFGEPGTNGQHSFYQLLHQGTDIIPIQFIGFKNSQSNFDITEDGFTSQNKLNANLIAQIMAFAKGNKDKNFFGNRPSSLLYADKLTPKILGAILAHYENKVMFQGLCWNINSFDQEGVQLGKILTNNILKKSDLSPDFDIYADFLGIYE